MISKLVFDRFKISLLFIYLLPVVVLLWFVASFSVNVPFWDEWTIAELCDKVFTGKASFEDFFIQHNEHRILFPRLIFVALAFLSKWDTRYEIHFSFFLVTITFFALYRLSCQVKSNYYPLQLTNIFTCIWIFSLVQYENWLWGFQLAWFLINTCLVIAVLLIDLSKNSPKRFYFAAIPCFIASFSLAHGLLTWLAVLPSIASVKGSSRQRKVRIIIWILIFVGTCAIYSIGYQKPSYHPDMLFFLKEPLVAGQYFFTLVATMLFPIAIISPRVIAIISPMVGVAIVLVFLFFSIYFIRKSLPKFQIDSEAAPWISIGFFALLFALVTTVGRAGFGVEQATSSRYTTTAILLLISTAHLWRLFSWKNSFIIGILTGILIVNSIVIVPQADFIYLQRQASKTCLELINFIDESLDKNCVQDPFLPSHTMTQVVTPMLERLGFRKFPKNLAFITAPDKVHGYLDSPPTGATPLSISKSGIMNAAGWAILPNRRELPKVVLFSYGSNQSFFAHAVVNLESPDVAKYLHSSRYSRVRWAGSLSSESLPLGETVINAWVYDPHRQQLIKLNGEPKVNVVE